LRLFSAVHREDFAVVTRREAKRRLINCWCSAVSELPIGRLPLYGIRHFVSDPNVKAVQKFGLYADDSDERRDRQIIEAWCQHDDGRPRQ
jgi:hypothetical protein